MCRVRSRKNEKGFALMTALIMSLALLALVVALATVAQHAQEESTTAIETTEALAIADSGLNRAIANISLTTVTKPTTENGEWLDYVGQAPDDPDGDTRTATMTTDGEQQVFRVRSAYWASKNGNTGFLEPIAKDVRENMQDPTFDTYEITVASTEVGKLDFQRGVQAVVKVSKETFQNLESGALTPLYINSEETPEWQNGLWQVNGQNHTMKPQSLATEATNGLAGEININPGNGQDEFYVDVVGGARITRDMLKDADSSYTASGKATMVYVKPKGNGNRNGLTLDGEEFPLYNGRVYAIYPNAEDEKDEITGEYLKRKGELSFRIWNDKDGANGNAMGKWWISLDGTNISFSDAVDTTTSAVVLSQMPGYSAWGVNDQTGTLYYYTIDGNTITANIEGAISGVTGTVDFEGITVATDGTIYLTNSASTSMLYKILPQDIDLNPNTAVTAVKVGDTKLAAGSNNYAFTNLLFSEGKLYGVCRNNKKIYELSTTDGSATYVQDLYVSGSFNTEAVTIDRYGIVYVVKSNSSNSEIWKMTVFPCGYMTKVCTINGSKSIRAIAAHPDGYLYAADANKWYKVDPIAKSYSTVKTYSTAVQDLAFNYKLEDTKLNGEDDGEEDATGGVENAAQPESAYLAGAGVAAVSTPDKDYADLGVATEQDSLISTMLSDSDAVLSGSDAYRNTKLDLLALAASFVGTLNGAGELVADSARCQILTPGTIKTADLGDVDNFKTSYVKGDVTLTGGVTGAGVLVVNGDLTVVKDFTFHGMLIVIGKVEIRGGEDLVVTGEEPDSALTMKADGYLSFRYLGSNAGLKSAVYMAKYDEATKKFEYDTEDDLVFATSNNGDQTREPVDKIYPAGTKLNFFIRVDAKNWSGINKVYDHWAFASNEGELDSYTGKPYCLISQINENTYKYSFEDLPGNQADWDYDDQVLLVTVNEPVSTELSDSGVRVFGSVLVEGDCTIGGDTKLWWCEEAVSKAITDLKPSWPVLLKASVKSWRALDKGDLEIKGLTNHTSGSWEIK